MDANSLAHGSHLQVTRTFPQLSAADRSCYGHANTADISPYRCTRTQGPLAKSVVACWFVGCGTGELQSAAAKSFHRAQPKVKRPSADRKFKIVAEDVAFKIKPHM